MKPLLYLILGAFFPYCSSVAALYLAQEKLIFVGSKLPSDFRFKPLPGASENYVEVDGATLSALHYQNESPRGLIFSCMEMQATSIAGYQTYMTVLWEPILLNN